MSEEEGAVPSGSLVFYLTCFSPAVAGSYRPARAWSLDPEGIRWSSVPNAPHHARSALVALLVGVEGYSPPPRAAFLPLPGSVPATARQLWLFVYFDAELEPARALALLCPLDPIPSMA